ncbi:PDZ domain-containing protein [Streptomyces sp. CRN 30]|uniref:PDZ domain-containing protein n=1 Tax=Streptomyces sp. CRN 30 TaxID=3075613 RepID=UPI002A82DC12|nr:PDZ domain-containing protein [Streptomyces sp. CRN 30]
MEQTALRPKPMPGRSPDRGIEPESVRPHPPHPPHRRRRRLTTVLSGLCAGTVLLLAGAGLATVGTTVLDLNRPAEARGRAVSAPPTAGAAAEAAVGATLGVVVVDDSGPGARVVDVHAAGAGRAAGLVRGDVLLVFGTVRVDSAADLGRAVAGVRPGTPVELTVRRAGGGYRQLTAVPGVVT